MSTSSNDGSPPILIELKPGPGLQRVALNPQDLAKLSVKALEGAMSTVQGMAVWASTTMDNLAGNPDTVQVEFGITLDFEGRALIAKAGAEAALSVTLTWNRGSTKSE